MIDIRTEDQGSSEIPEASLLGNHQALSSHPSALTLGCLLGIPCPSHTQTPMDELLRWLWLWRKWCLDLAPACLGSAV